MVGAWPLQEPARGSRRGIGYLWLLMSESRLSTSWLRRSSFRDSLKECSLEC
jgi:hypothetical protein